MTKQKIYVLANDAMRAWPNTERFGNGGDDRFTYHLSRDKQKPACVRSNKRAGKLHLEGELALDVKSEEFAENLLICRYCKNRIWEPNV